MPWHQHYHCGMPCSALSIRLIAQHTPPVPNACSELLGVALEMRPLAGGLGMMWHVAAGVALLAPSKPPLRLPQLSEQLGVSQDTCMICTSCCFIQRGAHPPLQ
jgi:hypothetical protein